MEKSTQPSRVIQSSELSLRILRGGGGGVKISRLQQTMKLLCLLFSARHETNSDTLCFFIRTFFYKNVEAEFCLKFKNILRTLPRMRVG